MGCAYCKCSRCWFWTCLNKHWQMNRRKCENFVFDFPSKQPENVCVSSSCMKTFNDIFIFNLSDTRERDASSIAKGNANFNIGFCVSSLVCCRKSHFSNKQRLNAKRKYCSQRYQKCHIFGENHSHIWKRMKRKEITCSHMRRNAAIYFKSKFDSLCEFIPYL